MTAPTPLEVIPTPEWVTGDTVDRDRWKRPMVIPEGGVKAVPFTRVSTLAKSLDSGEGLVNWGKRITLVGLMRRHDLRSRLAGIMARPGDPMADAKRDLDAIAKEAMEAGGSGVAASTGTALHSLSEAVDAGVGLADLLVDDDTRQRLAAYQAATHALEVVAAEQFVVCDELTAAGTLDRLYRLPDGAVVVGDVKSGAWDARYPLGVTTQVATYARGKRYRADGYHGDLHPDLDSTRGLLVHLPMKGAPACAVYLLDLTKGWEAAKVAADVLAVRKWKSAELIGGALDLSDPTPTTEA